MWPDCSNTNDRPVNGAALTAMGCTTLTAKASQGSGFTDGLLGANYAQAKANALDFIAYHFLDTSDGAVQAEHFANVVESACGRLDLGLMVDGRSATARSRPRPRSTPSSKDWPNWRPRRPFLSTRRPG